MVIVGTMRRVLLVLASGLVLPHADAAAPTAPAACWSR